MPLLARMIPGPVAIEIRPGAVDALPDILAESRVSSGGRVLVAVGRSTGDAVWARVSPGLPDAEVFEVDGGTIAAANELEAALHGGFDAVVAIGGGKTLDVAKYAATRAAVPMVAVATNLAHDGLCSPVASLEHAAGKGSYGVALPLAVVVDLDYVRDAPEVLVRAGIGDALSNLSAIEDWRLAHHFQGEAIDGLAVSLAESAGHTLLHHPGTIADDDFLSCLANGLVLSGMAMAVAGTSRPCSGACHEIIHAIDQLHPGLSNHGELAGVGALFATLLRGDEDRFDQLHACLTRHGLPRLPAELGLTDEQFAAAVLAAPGTRPGRYTILEHRALDAEGVREQVASYVARITMRDGV